LGEYPPIELYRIKLTKGVHYFLAGTRATAIRRKYGGARARRKAVPDTNREGDTAKYNEYFVLRKNRSHKYYLSQ
jgi:hypothetical protein